MEIKKIEIQDSNGNVYYPHTYSDVTFIKNASNNFKGETVEEALNELFQFADDGKKSIANVIGSPLSATDSFSSMSSKIQTLKNTFASNLNNKKQYASSSESLQTLISKISGIEVMDFASGYESGQVFSFEVALSFEPKHIIAVANCISGSKNWEAASTFIEKISKEPESGDVFAPAIAVYGKKFCSFHNYGWDYKKMYWVAWR